MPHQRIEHYKNKNVDKLQEIVSTTKILSRNELDIISVL